MQTVQKQRRKRVRRPRPATARQRAKVEQAVEATGTRRTLAGLVGKYIYLPREVIRRVKLDAIERDQVIRDTDPVLLEAGNMILVRGDSGVIGQIVADYYRSQDGQTGGGE